MGGRLFLTVRGSGGVYQFVADEGPPPLMETIDVTEGRFAFVCQDSTGSTLRMVAQFAPSEVKLRLGPKAVMVPRAATKGQFHSADATFTVRAHDADLLWQGRSYACGDLPVPEWLHDASCRTLQSCSRPSWPAQAGRSRCRVARSGMTC